MSMSRITSVEIPDGSVIVAEIAVVSFLDEEGIERWSVGMGTDIMQSHVVGLLAMVQHEFLKT